MPHDAKTPTWIVIWCADRAQPKVAAELQALNYGVYYPVSVHWSRRGVGRRQKPKVKVERPLLDRYILVQLDDPDDWPKVRRVRDVESVLGALDEQGKAAMFEMKTRQALGEWDETIEPTWETGEMVRLTEDAGAYADWTGRIERLERSEKARVELFDRILGKWLSKPVTISLTDLEKVA